MNTRSKCVMGTAIALTIIGVSWSYFSPGLSQFEDPGAVESFELLLDGEPFPDELVREHAYVVRLRFRPSSRLPDILNCDVMGMIVDPDLIASNTKELDGHEFYFQPPKGEKSTAHIEAMRDGKIVSVTPDPPSKGDDFLQLCGLIHPTSFRHYSDSTQQLEYLLWILHKGTPGAEGRKSGGVVQRIIYRKKFKIVD